MIARTQVENIIGKGFADKLEELVIDSGKLVFTKREMVETLGCANFIAAAKLNKILRRLNISTPAQLFKTDPFSLARVKGIGESCLFVALCILDASQYNIEEWWGWNDNDVKFSSFKAHAITRSKKRKQDV
jgi:hypothetical protein